MNFGVERRLTSGHYLLINDPFLSSTSIPVLPQQGRVLLPVQSSPRLATE